MRKSCNSAMHSTPENPPPATTNVSSRSRSGRIISDGGFFERVDKVVAQPQRVAQIFERDGVLFEAGHHAVG